MEFKLEKALQILEKTPSILNSFLLNLSDDWTSCNEGLNTWSAFDILGHLVHGEKTDWISRVDIVLGNGNSNTFTPFDRFAQFEDSKGKSISDLLIEFSELRKQNLKYLKSLNISEANLELTGIHPSFGQVKLNQLLATWVTHDLGHIAQISRVMAKQYKAEVGPWFEYISILKDRT